MTTTFLQTVFWLSAAGAFYAYIGYPLLLRVLSAARAAGAPRTTTPFLPTLSMIIPVHNERSVIEEKVRNTRELDYPQDKLEVLFVADGCTDGTYEYLATQQDGFIRAIEVHQRGGKAGALNAGLSIAKNEIIVFSDASIRLDRGSLQGLVQPFADPAIGCVSGEDRIEQMGGEGLYGQYELAIRRMESTLHSIVGASGSFYAQRRELCDAFTPALAPDFLSVLRTVERGYRAVAANAGGTMQALDSHRDEFQRKVRTLLRGMTTLHHYWYLLNPFKYGYFALALGSHKLMRWLVPVFLLGALAASAILAWQSPFFAVILAVQVAFYASAGGASLSYAPIARSIPVKVSAYFTTVNLATLSAWLKYFAGTRQELWSPTRR